MIQVIENKENILAAQMVELVDTQDSGSCGVTPVGVRVPLWALFNPKISFL